MNKILVIRYFMKKKERKIQIFGDLLFVAIFSDFF